MTDRKDGNRWARLVGCRSIFERGSIQQKLLIGLVAAVGVLVIAVVFLVGRVTASPSAEAPGSTTSLADVTTTSAAVTTTTLIDTTTTVSLITGDAKADAGDDFVVSMASPVALDGSRSTDPEQGTLEYTWTQVSGPDVTGGTGSLSGEVPEFTAPSAVVSLVFDLTVNDGETSDADRILVQVVENAGSAVFVDIDAEGSGLGNGTMASPVTSLPAGIGMGAGGFGADLYLMTPASGEYLVPESGLELPPNTSIYGGYGGDWVRDVSVPTLITGAPTVIVITPEGGTSVLSGLEIVGVNNAEGNAFAILLDTFEDPGGDVTLSDISVTAGDAGGSGADSVAVVAGGAFDLTIIRSSLAAGTAGTGRDGDDGELGDSFPPTPGGNASGRDPGGGFFPGGWGGNAFAGKGEPGEAYPSSLSGSAGKSGKNGGDGGTRGGSDGGIGGAGGLNEPTGESVGVRGGIGLPGRDGGGGGGGGGKVGLEGGGGGGGGKGGRPGNGGDGGMGGGVSFGLVLETLEGRIVIDSTTIEAGRGGDGGVGGFGSEGAGGADGGKGAKGSCSFLGCGAGQAGSGGDGGGGGAGSQGGQGGGGAGGASIGLVLVGAKSDVTIVNSTLQGGTGGTGGLGGLGGLSSVGAKGRAAGSGFVPDTYAPAASPGAGGGYSFGLFLVDPGDAIPKIEGSDLLGGVGGAGGGGPIPGPQGPSGSMNF
ncbi:MAG: hypothetical protein M3132_10625 [Actinomycetia bacterium]|nr:hypothetical protein [Actinomycetes bacterium]